MMLILLDSIVLVDSSIQKEPALGDHESNLKKRSTDNLVKFDLSKAIIFKNIIRETNQDGLESVVIFII